jgi:hypothetical protein
MELVRHFLVLGAKQIGPRELAESIERWEWQGPGVWIHVDPDMLTRHPAVFDAAARAAQTLGDTVNVPYLNAELKRLGTEWHVPQQVAWIVDELDRLRRHLVEAGV